MGKLLSFDKRIQLTSASPTPRHSNPVKATIREPLTGSAMSVYIGERRMANVPFQPQWAATSCKKVKMAQNGSPTVFAVQEFVQEQVHHIIKWV